MITRKKLSKIQIIFAILLLSLAGISISYSGFYDEITVYSIVDTATVTFTLEDYYGTEVWEVYCPDIPDIEIIIWHGFETDRLTQGSIEREYLGCEASLIASSWATEGSNYHVNMVWDNILPYIEFNASVIINYTGSIPAKIDMSSIFWDLSDDNYDLTPYSTLKIYNYTLVDNQWVKGDEIPEVPVQMLTNEYIGIEITVYLTDEDVNLIGINGACSFDISAVEWIDKTV